MLFVTLMILLILALSVLAYFLLPKYLDDSQQSKADAAPAARVKTPKARAARAAPVKAPKEEVKPKTITATNLQQTAPSAEEPEARVNISKIVSNIKSFDEQKVAVRELAKSLSNMHTSTLEIIGFYDISDELKEYFLLLIETTFRLSTATRITLKNPSVTSNADSYQSRLNKLVSENKINKYI